MLLSVFKFSCDLILNSLLLVILIMLTVNRLENDLFLDVFENLCWSSFCSCVLKGFPNAF